MKRIVSIISLAFIVVFIIVFMPLFEKKSAQTLLFYIERGRVGELTLTIRYADAFLSIKPISLDELIESTDSSEALFYKVVVTGDDLEEYSDVLYNIATLPLSGDSLVSDNDYMDVRVYYNLKNRLGKTIFEVIMWGNDGSIFVNGIKTKPYDAYEDIVKPFLYESTSPFDWGS